MKKFRFPFSIAYSDTDAGGIVYHGRYIEIAERARMEMMRGIELPAEDLGFVVRELSIKYMRPMHLADDIVVETEIINVGGASMDLQQKFVHDGTICAIMNITVVYIGADMRAKRIPDMMATHLDSTKEEGND
ncbi:MAG: thioesterase family protein [Alphaproteobacteria bacterium]|nr:thioesterase family protein [Alphaproteobacteria bacterium]